MPKFPVSKGFYGFETDDEQFLKPDPNGGTDPYKTKSANVGYDSRWKSGDHAGTHDRGYGDGTWAADNEAFLAASWKGDVDAPHGELYGLIDGQEDLPADKRLTGGGPVSANKHGGVGKGPPKFAPKDVGHSGQINRDSRGGRDRTGGRR